MRLLFSVVVVVALAGCVKDHPTPDGLATTAMVAAEEPGGAAAEVGAMEAVPGTRILTAALREPAPRRKGRGPSSGYGESSAYGPARHLNQLFYDLDGQAARWLFDSDRQRILEMTPLERTGEERGVRAYFYRVAAVVQGDDGDEFGGVHLALSSADGTGYTVVAEGVDQVLGRFPVDDRRLVIWYRSGGSVSGVEVDLDKPSVLHRTVLAMPAARDTSEV